MSLSASAPANLTSDPTSSKDGSYTLSWDAVFDAASYELLEGSNTITLSSADIHNRSHSLSAKAGASYSYQVRACHTNTACTDWSSALTVTVSRNCAGNSAQASGFHDGDGSITSPYLICNYTQLAKMDDNLAALKAHYKLGQDIEANASYSAGVQRDGDTSPACTAYDPAIASGTDGHPDDDETCTGWTPVGAGSSTFTGSLEGDGYEIRNLYINIETGTIRVGLFSWIGPAGIVQNVGMTDAYIKSDVNYPVSSLAGRNDGNIRNSYASGSVTLGGTGAHVGGLVGQNRGSISNSYASVSVIGSASDIHVGGLVGYNRGSISNSYATGSVRGTANASYVGGLLGSIDYGGSLSNSYATGEVRGTGNTSNVGGLVGGIASDGGSISNSYATGEVRGTGNTSNLGGLVGSIPSGGSISKSYATGTVSGGDSNRAGGLVGRNYSGGSISDSYATGSITATGSGPTLSYVGGLVGQNQGTISGTNYFVDDPDPHPSRDAVGSGSCPGCSRATGGTDAARKTWLQDNLNEGLSTGMNWSSDHWDNFTGTGVGHPLLKYVEVAPSCSDTTLSGETACEASGNCRGATASNRIACENTPTGIWIRNASWLAGGNECGGSTGVACGDLIPDCSDDSPLGEGSSNSPYLVCNYDQLKKMGDATDADSDSVPDALTKHYELVAHIDASPSRSDGEKRGTAGDTDCTEYDGDSGNTAAGDADHDDTCTGWAPVGNATTAFTGSLQGAGHTIRNLYINTKAATATRVGLFGQIGRAGVVQNVGLTDAYIKGDTTTAASRVGSLVGENEGSLSNSYATGSVTVGSSFNAGGGLVGRNDGSISNSYATASITGASMSPVGGLVGRNNGRLSNSYATGSVTGSTSFIGGLVGRNDGRLSNGYATGPVRGTGSGSTSNIGGLVGHNATGGSLSNSYASGSVSGVSAADVGGLVGNNSGSITDKNYFVDDDGTNGVEGGTCAAANCIQAGDAGTTTPTARQTWLQDTFGENTASGADPAGLGWLTTNWDNFTGTDIGYPVVKYAAVEEYCTDSAHSTKTECEAVWL